MNELIVAFISTLDRTNNVSGLQAVEKLLNGFIHSVELKIDYLIEREKVCLSGEI